MTALDRTSYTVTKRAGPRVAGVAAAPGDTLELTEAEAAYDLLQGALVRKGDKLPDIFDKTSPGLAEMQARARGREPAAAPAAARPAAAEAPAAQKPDKPTPNAV